MADRWSGRKNMEKDGKGGAVYIEQFWNDVIVRQSQVILWMYRLIEIYWAGNSVMVCFGGSGETRSDREQCPFPFLGNYGTPAPILLPPKTRPLREPTAPREPGEPGEPGSEAKFGSFHQLYHWNCLEAIGNHAQPHHESWAILCDSVRLWDA